MTIDQRNAKVIELTRWFFRLLDETTDEGIRHVTPMLVRILQEWDNSLCGFTANTDDAKRLDCHTAVDVRILYVALRNFKASSSKKREKHIEAIAKDDPIVAGQMRALCLFIDGKVAPRNAPLILLPIYRMQGNVRARRKICRIFFPPKTRAASEQSATA
jgi:hypothetical protein